MPETEADTCHMYAFPKTYGVGWTDEQINEPHSFTQGSIIPTPNNIGQNPTKPRTATKPASRCGR
jgi:hypothetical protein